MNFPDPDEIFQIVERVREAFNRAADNSTGNAQRLFQRLNDKVQKLYTQATDPNNAGRDPQKQIMSMLPAMFEVQMIMSQIKREAERDPAVLQTLQTLAQEVQDEAKTLLPLIAQIIPNLPGLPKLAPIEGA